MGKGLKSGSCVIPGQFSSDGVPNNLKIRFNWSSTSLPGNSGRPAFANSAKIHPADHISIEVVYNCIVGGNHHLVSFNFY